MMINGLAIWHYPHRNDLENARFFAENGFASISMHGRAMAKICMDEQRSADFAALIQEKNLVLTAHGKLPASHEKADVEEFKLYVDSVARWQKKYGLLAVYSFDVPQEIRDNILPYVEYILQYKQFEKVAVEDFGLTEAEKAQIEPLKGNERFGYLIDVGHMNIRLRGLNKEPLTLFTNSPDECPVTKKPSYQEFLRAFQSKDFPIFEIHLHNNDGVSDGHCFLEDGTIDMQIMADVLLDFGYDGIVTIESVPRLQGCVYPESDKRIVNTLGLWEYYVANAEDGFI